MSARRAGAVSGGGDMALARWRLAALCVCALRAGGASSSQEIMTKMTTSMIRVINVCKNELSLGDHIMQDFMNFWDEEYELVHRELGCAISCIVSKHDLFTEDLTMHQGNAKEFALNHGADEALASQLIAMIHECEEAHAAVGDDCLRMLEISKCFRSEIHALKWAPSMEEVLEEIMAEA